MKGVDERPCGEVDLDVDEDHDAGGNVEGAEGRVHHVTHVPAQLGNAYF